MNNKLDYDFFGREKFVVFLFCHECNLKGLFIYSILQIFVVDPYQKTLIVY